MSTSTRSPWQNVFAIPLLVMVLLPISANASEDASTGETAEEAYLLAVAAYNRGDHQRAVQGFRQILVDYGQNIQAKPLIRAVRHPLVLCLMRLGEFAEAVEIICQALTDEEKPSQRQAEDFHFFRAVCEMQTGNYPGSRDAFSEFLLLFPKSRYAGEASILAATSWMQEGQYLKAANALRQLRTRKDHPKRSRIAVLELACRVQGTDLDGGIEVVRTEAGRSNEMVEITSFHTLTLMLGDLLLAEERFRDAIACFQRIWPGNQLINLQNNRLRQLKESLETKNRALSLDPLAVLDTRQTIDRIEADLARFVNLASFDASVRLRLGTAFQAMGRYREAAMVVSQLIESAPPDPVVEKAAVNMIQCWYAAESWRYLVGACELVQKRFPSIAEQPQIRYLEGIGQQRLGNFDQAGSIFQSISQEHAESEYAARAFFMEGFTDVLSESYDAAIQILGEFARKFPNADLADAACYWLGMAYSMAGDSSRARDVLADYLSRYPEGQFRTDAIYRRAYCAQAMKDYATAVSELSAFVAENTDHPSTAEALLLLGDALMATGEIDAGIQALRRIPLEEVRHFEEGWFKIGVALRQRDDNEAVRQHFEEFCRMSPRSSRLAEAVYWIGWAYQNEGDPERAKDVYWKTIEELGNESEALAVEDLLASLAKFASTAEQKRGHAARLQELQKIAQRDRKTVFAARLAWAAVQVVPADEREAALANLAGVLGHADLSSISPRILADHADASGREEESRRVWLELLKWNPRAPQRDRAFAALAKLEHLIGNDDEALEWCNRFQATDSESLLAAEIALLKSKVQQDRGQLKEAAASLEQVLSLRSAPGDRKAEALYTLGELALAEENAAAAISYFQRIYVMYGKWHHWVGKAYLQSGQAFERLNDRDAAIRTYKEMLASDDLKSHPDREEVRQRLGEIESQAGAGSLVGHNRSFQ